MRGDAWGVKRSGGNRGKRELKKTESEKRMMIPSPRGRNSEKDLMLWI
jgi:hypothetical protein